MPAATPVPSTDATATICHFCSHEFNAERGEWCGCLTEDRSIVCPRCQKCFCSAPVTWKRSFWASAGQTLKRRRLEANRTRFTPAKALLRDEILRPLILLVEDNNLIHLLATRMIGGLGYGIVGATNGKDAIEMARIYEPDLILTDALMPVMDGREMCRKVKSDPVLGGTPVVIMSSVYRDSTHRFEARTTHKANEYLVKPVNEATLRDVLHRYVGAPARQARV